jgi:hypothetical protein
VFTFRCSRTRLNRTSAALYRAVTKVVCIWVSMERHVGQREISQWVEKCGVAEHQKLCELWQVLVWNSWIGLTKLMFRTVHGGSWVYSQLIPRWRAYVGSWALRNWMSLNLQGGQKPLKTENAYLTRDPNSSVLPPRSIASDSPRVPLLSWQSSLTIFFKDKHDQLVQSGCRCWRDYCYTEILRVKTEK